MADSPSPLTVLAHDLIACVKLAANAESAFRLLRDFAISRFIRLIPAGERSRIREVQLRGDARIRYRLNQGDLHSIREIWFNAVYRLPFVPPPGILLDLGANIGMTSVWLAKKCSFPRVIAVEPDPRNAALLKENLELNGIAGHVVEAAVGPKDGSTRMEFSEISNLGRVAQGGSPVPMNSVKSILSKHAVARVGLVKIDIEGSEQQLLEQPAEWLESADAIIIEFHPTVVDCRRLVDMIEAQGFRHIPAGSIFPGNMDCFVRTTV